MEKSILDLPVEEREVLNKLKYCINKKKSLDEICQDLELEIYQVYELVLKLKELGQNYDIVDHIPVKVVSKQNDLEKFNISSQNTKQFCFVSDTHYGSLADRPDIMRSIYSECDQRGIDSIFCAGDFTDGYYPKRPEYVAHQKITNPQAMIDYVKNAHPYSKYIKFYTIGGNHDESFKKTEGIDIIKEISKDREDIIYLGPNCADIIVGKTKLRIYHGYGNKKNLYERTKKYYSSLEDKPDILQLGHIHRSFYAKFDETYVFQTSSLIDLADFAKKRGCTCERSCWFAKVEYDNDGNISKILPEIKTYGPELVRKRKYH